MELDLLELKPQRGFPALSPVLVLEYMCGCGCCGEGQTPHVSQGCWAGLEGGSNSSACEQLQLATEQIQASLHASSP